MIIDVEMVLANRGIKNFHLVVIILTLIVFFTACEKEFSINSEYEDFPIVYAIFDTKASTQYVKIYKSYLTEDNPMDKAKDWHNYTYLDSIDVYVEEYDSKNNLLRTIYFDTTTNIVKEQGIFDYPTQLLYEADFSLKRGCNYKLYVFNPYTKKIVVGQTSVVDTVNLIYPKRTIISPILLSFPFKTSFYTSFSRAENAYYYDVTLLYYYTEVLSDNSKRQPKPIKINLGKVNGENFAPKYQTSEYQSYNFYTTLAKEIVDSIQVVKRHTDSLVIEITSAGQDLYKYMLASTPSNTINQTIGTYTNLTAYNTDTKEDKYVLGVLSTRSITRFHYDDLATPGARDSLFYGVYTSHLKFTDIH